MAKRNKNEKSDQKKKIPPKTGWKRQLFFRHLIAIGLIAGVALLAYSNTFHVPFHFDDRPNITENPNVQIKVFTWDRLERLVKNTYKESIRIFSYFTLALNYYFGELNVFGYHLVNFFIHVASGIFLYWFLILTFNLPSLKEKYGSISYKVALFSSLIFICHPIQTQSVTYIVQRMSSMAGMFYLLSLILYIKGRLSFGRPRLFYFGGMVLGQRYINVIIEGYQYRTFTMSERVLTQFRVVLYYLSLLLYPHPSRLNLDYDFPISKSILDPPTTLISLLIVGGLIGY